MPRRMLPVLVCAMLAAGGCSRTDDGSVVLAKPLATRHLDLKRADLGRFDLRHLGREKPQPVAAPRVMPVEVFPIMPAQATRPTRTAAGKVPRRGRHKAMPAHTNSQATVDADAGLACIATTASGKRVHVVCK